jgi:hypothetical protein
MRTDEKIVGIVFQASESKIDEVIKNLEGDRSLKLLYVRRQRYPNSYMLVLEMKKAGVR